MITTDSDGVLLPDNFKRQFAMRNLNENEGPVERIIFARRFPDRWHQRNVTEMFFQCNPIQKHIAQNYGTSSGTEVELVFDVSPYPVLYGISLTSDDRLRSIAVAFEPSVSSISFAPFNVGDWIEVSDYNNIEYRRITNLTNVDNTGDTVKNLTFSTALDNDYDIDNMEVRYAFAIQPTNTRLESPDFFNGWIQMRLGFANRSQEVILYQGEVVGGHKDPNNTVTLTTQDKVKSLVERQTQNRFEVDDRGVASVPTAKGWNSEMTPKFSPNVDSMDIQEEPNVGTGKASDIIYANDKLPEINIEDVWVVTFNGREEKWYVNGIRYKSTNSEGYDSSGVIGSREWQINETENLGWSFTISEGAIPFVTGDQFSFFTAPYEDETVLLVKGRGFNVDPIERRESNYLNPSYIIEFFLADVLELNHNNIATGTETDILTKLSAIRQLDIDFRTELRGVFPEGTPAIEIIDDALRSVNGWMYSTHDDHLALFYYTPFSLENYDTTVISTDYDDPEVMASLPNAADPTVEPRGVDTVKNQMKFSYANGDVSIDDDESQGNFGTFKLDVKGEDLITHDISSGYEMSENTARNAVYRALQRHKNPIFRGTFVGLPALLLLEIGDIPIVFSRDVQFSDKPFWITGLQIDYVNLTVTIFGELATQLDGKFGRIHNQITRSPNMIWTSAGFIGMQGEERLVFVADDVDELAIFTGNPIYEPRVGKPDRWGNYVGDAFVVV